MATLARGQLVTRPSPLVRHCIACAEELPDSCLTGDYSERGITRLHGLRPSARRGGSGAIGRIPKSLAVSAARGADVDLRAGASTCSDDRGRQPWQLERALVIGAGAIGLLMTYLLRLADVEVWTASLESENELIEQSGARYASTHDNELSELGKFDLVIEAAATRR